jgi:hypothetical protein
MKSFRSVIPLAVLVGLTIGGCGAADPADPAADPAAESPDTASAGAASAVLEGLRFDVRRDPG